MSAVPFHAANLAGEEQGIEALCRKALDGSLLRAQGLLRLAEGDFPCCLEFIAAYDPCGKPATLVVTMLNIAPADNAASLPGVRDAGGASWEKPVHDPAVSTQEFQTTFNLAAVGIAHVGLDGQWLRVNRQMCDMLGYTREELLATTFRAVSYEEDQHENDALLQEALEGKRSAYMLEKRYVRKDGSLTWAHLAVSLLRDQAGHP
ncbi:MAG: PAS domain S-box protein, partial [Burkholderiaceae bacterium]